MKNKLLMTVLMCLSVTLYAQNGVETFTSTDPKTTWKEFKSENKIIKTTKMASDVVRLETNGSEVDEDYNKITWVFIGDKLMNCVVEFNEDQTVESLIKKYGEAIKTPSGCEWFSENNMIQFIFHKNSPNELMIIYLTGSYAFTPKG